MNPPQKPFVCPATKAVPNARVPYLQNVKPVGWITISKERNVYKIVRQEPTNMCKVRHANLVSDVLLVGPRRLIVCLVPWEQATCLARSVSKSVGIYTMKMPLISRARLVRRCVFIAQGGTSRANARSVRLINQRTTFTIVSREDVSWPVLRGHLKTLPPLNVNHVLLGAEIARHRLPIASFVPEIFISMAPPRLVYQPVRMDILIMTQILPVHNVISRVLLVTGLL